MKHTTRRTREKAVVSCLLLAGLFPAGALAAEGGLLKALHPYAQLGIGYDSNVFRVETAALAGDLITGSELDDTVSTIETGINAKLTHQKQVFSMWGRVFHNDYSHFDEVDFTGADAKLAWEWAAGTLWSGNVGYEYRRGLRDFANQSVPRIDVTSTNLVSGEIARQLSNHLQLAATASITDIDFSEENRLDLRRRGSGISLIYVSRNENTVSLGANYSERESDGAVRVSEGVADLDYTELMLGPTVDWGLSDRTRIRAELQYVQRDASDPALLDYAGMAGRLSGVWTTTSNNSIDVTFWRQVSSLGDEIANFAIVTGVSVEPTLRIGERSSVGVKIAYEERDFRGEPEFSSLPSPIISQREDKLLAGTVRLERRFAEKINLSLEYGAQDRNSSRTGRDYDFQRVQLNVRVGL